jgi:hypothetical protein
MLSDLELELVKTLLSLGVTLITLLLGWLIGQRLSAYWAFRQKQKEIDLNTLNKFYSLYGEFFAVWKLWHFLREEDSAKTIDLKHGRFEEVRLDLVNRISKAEGELEAIFVKVSTEKDLEDSDILILGKFRETFQQLRDAIKSGNNLDWRGPNSAPYKSFKRLAFLVSTILVGNVNLKQVVARSKTFIQVTDDTWKDDKQGWILTEEEFEAFCSKLK